MLWSQKPWKKNAHFCQLLAVRLGARLSGASTGLIRIHPYISGRTTASQEGFYHPYTVLIPIPPDCLLRTMWR